jgi:hypothetical protein
MEAEALMAAELARNPWGIVSHHRSQHALDWLRDE